ncbi:MAG: hypothetical protein ABSB35_40370 [Bryobacteraceae bacterium]
MESTKKTLSPVMHFLTAQALRGPDAGKRAVRVPMIECPPVLVAPSHLPLKHLADQPGH